MIACLRLQTNGAVLQVACLSARSAAATDAVVPVNIYQDAETFMLAACVRGGLDHAASSDREGRQAARETCLGLRHAAGVWR